MARSKWPRLAWRGAQAGAITLRPGSLQTRRGRYAAWCAAVLGDLGIEITTDGTAPARAALFAANHLSWLDSLVLAAAAEVSFVAKHELRRWPLIGTMIADSGGVFIRRDDPQAIEHAVNDVARCLAAGHAVCVFPEATTGDGQALRPFRPPFFESAVVSQAAVVPVALRYRSGGEDCGDALWRQDEPFGASLRRVLRLEGPLRAQLSIGEPIESAGRSRWQLAQAAEREVARMLGRPHDLPAPPPGAPHPAMAADLDLLRVLLDVAGRGDEWAGAGDLLATPLARLGLDSLAAIPVLLALEEKLQRPIPDDALAGFMNGATVGDFLRAMRA